MINANKKLIIVAASSLVLGFLISYFWMNGQVNNFKISYLQEYCLGLSNKEISIEQVRARIGDVMAEKIDSNGDVLFTTSNTPFAPLCRIQFEQTSGSVTGSVFIRD